MEESQNKLNTSRLEAFSDGVIAIIITITVLELKVPLGHSFSSLIPLFPVFLTYVISFQTIGTYWNNHHHLLRATKEISGGIMWANLNLLFWLSIIPFAAGWLGENPNQAMPTALYGATLLFCALSYFILQNTILSHQKDDLALKKAIGSDFKGKVSLLSYLITIPFAFIITWVSYLVIIAVAIMWLVPDKRIESHL